MLSCAKEPMSIKQKIAQDKSGKWVRLFTVDNESLTMTYSDLNLLSDFSTSSEKNASNEKYDYKTFENGSLKIEFVKFRNRPGLNLLINGLATEVKAGKPIHLKVKLGEIIIQQADNESLTFKSE